MDFSCLDGLKLFYCLDVFHIAVCGTLKIGLVCVLSSGFGNKGTDGLISVTLEKMPEKDVLADVGLEGNVNKLLLQSFFEKVLANRFINFDLNYYNLIHSPSH